MSGQENPTSSSIIVVLGTLAAIVSCIATVLVFLVGDGIFTRTDMSKDSTVTVSAPNSTGPDSTILEGDCNVVLGGNVDGSIELNCPKTNGIPEGDALPIPETDSQNNPTNPSSIQTPTLGISKYPQLTSSLTPTFGGTDGIQATSATTALPTVAASRHPSSTPLQNTTLTPVPATSTQMATNTPAPATSTQVVTNTPVPATSTQAATNTPLPTNTPATTFAVSWSAATSCHDNQNRAQNNSSVAVDVYGEIFAQPVGGDIVRIAMVPDGTGHCPVGAWCGPIENLQNHFPNGFEGTVWGTTRVFFNGDEIFSNTIGPSFMICSP